MNRITMIAALLALCAGCKKNTEDKPAPPPAGSAAMGSGSAAMTPPKPLTADEVAKRVHECWGFWNAGKWDDLAGCYAKDASYEAPGSGMPGLSGNAAIAELFKNERAAFSDQKGEIQLLMVDGRKSVAIALITGKNTGPMKTPSGEMAATNNKAGMYYAQVLLFDDTGKATHEADFFDTATELGQLKPSKDHPVRPAMEKLPMPASDIVVQSDAKSDDAKAKANLATFQQLTERFNKHDAKGFGELLADDVVWSEQPQPKDLTKKELMTELPAMWKGFSDLNFTVGDSWAVGDYVAALETFNGTNDGDLSMMHIKKTGKKVNLPFLAVYKIDTGKVKAAWIFYQGQGLASQLGIAQAPPTIAKTGKEAPTAAKPVVHK